MDADAVKKAVELSGGKLLTVEDHYAYVSRILKTSTWILSFRAFFSISVLLFMFLTK